MNLWADEKIGCSTSIRFMNHLHTTTPNYSIVFPSFFLRFVLTGENDSNTQRVVEYFFSQLRRREKISVFRNVRIHVDTLNVTSYFIKSKKEYF